MKKHRASILTVMLIIAASMIFWQWFKYDWNPHYLDNKAVSVDSTFYSPDKSIAVVYYTLDVGARGLRHYKSILTEKDNDDDLIKNNLPPELIVQKWKDNNTLEVVFDEYEGYR